MTVRRKGFKVKCKDCDAEIVTPVNKHACWNHLFEHGWRWMDLVDPESDDPANGWRCENCVAGWKVICEDEIASENGRVLN